MCVKRANCCRVASATSRRQRDGRTVSDAMVSCQKPPGVAVPAGGCDWRICTLDAGCWMQYGVAWQAEIGVQVQCEGRRRKKVRERGEEGEREGGGREIVAVK